MKKLLEEINKVLNEIDIEDMDGVIRDVSGPDISDEILDDLHDYKNNDNLANATADEIQMYLEDLLASYDKDSEKFRWLSNPNNLVGLAEFEADLPSGPEVDYTE